MLIAVVSLFLVACGTSWAFTLFARRVARRLKLMDAPGDRKVHVVPTPRNGGIGIFWGIALPLVGGMVGATFLNALMNHARPRTYAGPAILHDAYAQWMGVRPDDRILQYLPGMVHQRPLAILLLVCTFFTHLLGLWDDRKAMRPVPKLIGQLAIATLLVVGGEWMERGGFRLPMPFGPYLGAGFYLSVVLSVLWIVALTNAFNFLDNMDGLSAGVAFICGFMFLIAAASNQQWFICGLLVIFLGSVLGFLCFNFPPASIFMGDGGSMVLGFFLSALTIRTTYYEPGKWYAVLMPLMVLAVPLYDLVVVSLVRLARGKSPMSADTNHFSHRLVRHGFSKRNAVLVIYGVTLASGLSAPLLARVDAAGAVLLGAQCLSTLVVIGILERVGEHTA